MPINQKVSHYDDIFSDVDVGVDDGGVDDGALADEDVVADLQREECNSGQKNILNWFTTGLPNTTNFRLYTEPTDIYPTLRHR
jgi:hypothetical protein